MTVVHTLRKAVGRSFGALSRYWRAFVLGRQLDREVIRWKQANGDKTLRLTYPLNSESIVFDCGGYRGDWTNAIFERYSCNIYVFEPVRDFFLHIEDRFRNNSKIHAYNFGLHSRTEQAMIAPRNNRSSVFLNSKGGQLIALIDVVTFLQDKKIDRIGLLKLNIEGGEYELLRRILDAGLIAKISDIQIQFHDFVPDARHQREALRNNLARTHYLTYDFEFVWENWRKK